MTLLHLRVYEQLLKAVQQPQPEQRDTRVHVACNDDVELKLTDSEARALISQVESMVHGQILPGISRSLVYVMYQHLSGDLRSKIIVFRPCKSRHNTVT